MIGKMTAVAVLGALVSVAGVAQAQDHKGEISGNVGWTFSDGVTGNGILAGDGNVYNEINPKDSFSWGLTLGFFFTENSELEFIYDQQQSTLEAKGTTTREIGDFNIKNYHGVYAYNFGTADSPTRPFIFLGAGATSYPGLSFTGIDGSSREIGGNTKFSGTFGLGVKVYPGSNVGLRLQARWTPTYIKSDSEGYWCDPYWGCY